MSELKKPVIPTDGGSVTLPAPEETAPESNAPEQGGPNETKE